MRALCADPDAADDSDSHALAQLRIAAAAKRRLIFQRRQLGLPLEARDEQRGTGVAFDLLSSVVQARDHRTRRWAHHARSRGVERERARALFGDDWLDDQAALDRHYAQGPPAQWRDEHVSEYGTMHPAEDWAETFAYYLHIRGVLHTAASWGVTVRGPVLPGGASTQLSVDPAALEEDDVDQLLAGWLLPSSALNAVNRSMGEADLYPFVLSPVVMVKLGVIHERVTQRGRRGGP